jgi:chromosome segregation protein
MSAPLPEAPAERLGVIGSRQLTAVQTMNIARLTAHPVALIPQTFIAVTGMGPVDSNESGKTSFLSAVSLLLGDPEWRVAGTGAASVEALLFEPITAGAAIIGATAASDGYIVGVFADPNDPVATAHTVWMKISATRPYLQVRHAPGVHLALGGDDRARHEQAPAIYRALGGEPLGSTEFAHALYGRSPRVLAYVASRGSVRSRPSLLKLDAGTFTPAQIGDALITLTGRAALFDRDQQDRRDLADKQAELAGHIERDKQHTAQEDEILRHVHIRQRLRSQADTAAAHWRAHRARAVLDTYARAKSARAMLEDARPARDKASEELALLRQDLEDLRDAAALREAVRDTSKRLAQRKQAYDAAVRQDGALERDLGESERQLRESRNHAAGYDLTREGTAAERAGHRDELQGTLNVAMRSRDDAQAEVNQAAQDLELAEHGQFGLAGAIVRALGPDIGAVSLADATRLAPDTRHTWEARLAPWREAVCVPPGHQVPDVLGALRDIPGAVILTTNEPVKSQDDDEPSASPELPEGVLVAPQAALPLLRRLAAYTAAEGPVPHASDPSLGIHIVGGFGTPVIGGEDIRVHLRDRLRQATGRLEALGRRIAALEAAVGHAIIAAARAEAAERVAIVAPEARELAGQLAAHRADVLPLLEQERDDAWTADQEAQRALKDRDQNINRLGDLIRTGQEQLRTKDLEIERLTKTANPDDAILAAWGRGRDAAGAELRWPPAESGTNAAGLLQEEATPPPLHGGPDEVERRGASTLAEAARMQLGTALSGLEYQVEGAGAAPAELRYSAERYLKARQSGDDDPHGSLFESTLADLQAWLTDGADRDRTAPEQVDQARASRAEAIQFAASKTRELQESLQQTQQAITQRAQSALTAISNALDTLNRKSGGLGAKLDCEVLPPEATDRDWTTHVVPRWRRNPGGPMLSYDNVTNTAQEKLFSIHLVLAALLAAPYPQGRVLILDELADSLGAEHRREVLDAITSVAKEHGITVLATCQDAIMAEARPHCGEILFFQYPSKSAALNRPTRMFGIDRNGARVELTAEALMEGRLLT